MGYEQKIPEATKTGPLDSDLIGSVYSGLAPLANRLSRLDAAIADLGTTGDRSVAVAAKRLRKQIRDFEPSVTMIGQVKAGKTTLVNAMAGWPTLLPADVNPWTSVVTSIHLAHRPEPAGLGAAFQFFSEEEWNRLLHSGGRVGELAARAGADDEVEKVRRQLQEMREKSRARLGRKFELLLGQSHDYERFDEDLIERYVCLGDDFDDEGAQGRFADITRSADLRIGRPDVPVGLCLRDTPGVNDTFMIREQITINAIRESRLCVVVLSAHQALSSVDMALIRMISNVKSRDVVIFVNRIDELADPAREVPEIRASIAETLRRYDGPVDAEILFGSGYWANHALTKAFALETASGKALLNWAKASLTEDHNLTTIDGLMWHLSGLPALGRAIADRIAGGAGARLEARVAGAARNLGQSLAASHELARNRRNGTTSAVAPADVGAGIDAIGQKAKADLAQRLNKIGSDFVNRSANAHRTFLSRATASLVKHLEVYGENEIWKYDPAGLRVLLRSSYRVYAGTAGKAADKVFAEAAAAIDALCSQAFGLSEGKFVLEPPQVPQAPPPVVLGQTIALDLRANWWTRFWRRRRSYAAFADEFSTLIHDETMPIVTALKTDHVDPFELTIGVVLDDFIASQRTVLADLARTPNLDAAAMRRRFGAGDAPPWQKLNAALAELDVPELDAAEPQ